LLTVFLLKAVQVGFGQQQSHGDSLKILTFNVYGRPNSDWPLRQTLILNELSANPPDLIGLQEIIEPGGAHQNRAAALADSLLRRTGIRYQVAYERTHFSWNQWFEGIAILSRHIVLENEAQALPPGLFPRAVIYCRLLTPAGVVNFFNTHLSFGNQESVRISQVEALREYVAKKSADRFVTANFIGGDFNAIPHSTPILMVTAPASGTAFIDSWMAANPGRMGFTVPSDNPNARIDYIFYAKQDQVQLIHSHIAFNQTNTEGIYPSDHLGVLSTVVTTQRKLPIQILSPAVGEEVAGEVSISWTVQPAVENLHFRIFISADAGKIWREEWSGNAENNTYTWNTLTSAEGARYRVRVAAMGDSSFGMAQTAGNFVVNNPGNAPPEIELLRPLGGEKLQGVQNLLWNALDADGDPLRITIEISSNGGVSWEALVSDLPNDGAFAWDTRQSPNSQFYLVRLRAADAATEITVTSELFAVENARTTLPASQFAHTEGRGDGYITGAVVDSSRLTGHLYRVTFDDTLFEQTTYDVFDKETHSFVVQHAGELDGETEGPRFDGMHLIVFDYSEAEINQMTTGWSKGPTTLGFAISTPTVIVNGQRMESLSYPADYKITLFDSVVDSTSHAFGFDPKPIKFKVWNLTENRRTEILFSEFDHNQTVSDLDKLTILEPNELGDLQLSWNIFFQGASNHIPPAAGDEFTLTTLKPFTHRDVFEFRGDLPTSVANTDDMPAPQELTLHANYPNPFNPTTVIKYDLPRALKVKLTIYNVLGQKVRTLIDTPQSAGFHRVAWAGQDDAGIPVASGIYVYRLQAEKFTLARKMLLLR
ncbi:MAG: endonuclease/exonuclease/phosphatase family protein, partial [bacterium]